MGDQTRFWTKWRMRFRVCRICVWLCILAVVCAVTWLDVIGLPDFAKRPLIQALHDHGIVLQFVRLRLKPDRGLVADNVRIGGTFPGSPTLSVQELRLQIDYRALLHRKLQLDGVVLRQGKFVLPISASNEPPCALTFEHIQTELRFETNDMWSLDNLQANFAGAKFNLSGQVAHASAVSTWGMFHGKQGIRGASQNQLKKIATTLSRIHFNPTSQLSLNVHGDARHLNSFFIFLTVNAPGVQTPWGRADNMTFVAHSAAPMQTVDDAAAPALEIDWKAQLGRLKTPMAAADYFFCAGSWHATGEIDWTTEIARLKTEKLNADFISCGGFWRAPDLEVTNLVVRLGGGRLHAAVRLNMKTRELSFTNSSCFNLQAVAALLTEKCRERLDQFTLPLPPVFRGSGSLILPSWTNNLSGDWHALSTNIQPALRLDGELEVTNPAVSGFSLDEVRAHFSYSNEIWTVPEASAVRADSRLNIEGRENDRTKDYQWHVRGAVSPNLVGLFLDAKAAHEFHHLQFARPLSLDAQIQGRLYDYDSLTASGHAALDDFSIRGEHIDHVESDFRYAHEVAEFFQPRLDAPDGQKMRADEVKLDWPGDRVYFINGLGTAYPQSVANAIGPQPADVMRPYHFREPPTAIVNGYAPLRDPTNADLDFRVVQPAKLECVKLYSEGITGEIHWMGQTLVLTNLAGPLYGGHASGHARFDFTPHGEANYTFATDFQDVDLHRLAEDLSTPSNHLEHLEGRVTGRFILTSGFSGNWRSCNGYGRVDLRDGLLWDVPAFGGLSPFFNMISPGLGNSRATDASAQFFMTNGVMATDNLKIHTKLMLLQCNGTVNLHGDLSAHFTSELLHDVRGIGPLFTVGTWPVGKLFEFKVTGTWSQPKIRPLYFPAQLLLDMLHPIHFLENLAPEKKTNTTPAQQSP